MPFSKQRYKEILYSQGSTTAKGTGLTGYGGAYLSNVVLKDNSLTWVSPELLNGERLDNEWGSEVHPTDHNPTPS